MNTNNFEKDGKAGEEAFRDWLNKEKIGYLYIDQTIDFFSHTFKENLKRPDFLLLVPSVGFIAIDVKHHDIKTYGEVTGFTLNIAKELDKAVEFEEVSKTALWYAYKRKDDPSDLSWYLINPRTIIQQGIKKESTKEEGSEFFVTSIEKFKVVTTEKDLKDKLISLKLEGKTPPLRKLVEQFHKEQLLEELT